MKPPGRHTALQQESAARSEMSIVSEDPKKSAARGCACRSARLPPDYPTQDCGTSRSMDSVFAGYFESITAAIMKDAVRCAILGFVATPTSLGTCAAFKRAGSSVH